MASCPWLRIAIRPHPPAARRALARALCSHVPHHICASSADDRTTFSTVWQGVDRNRHDGQLVTPDPLEYLRGFDRAAATADYRRALLQACEIQSDMRVLDVGCGLGVTTRALARALGDGDGQVDAVDVSVDAIAAACAAGVPPNAQFHAADVFSLPFEDHSFDCVVEDRVLQHLHRPLEALKEMVRVARPGARVVVGNPDWRSFQIDVTGAGGHGEAGTRWGEARRPEGGLSIDLAGLTWRMLSGVIPKLTQHSYLGIAQPRLLRAAGLHGIELRPVVLQLHGRTELERVVPITYFTRLAMNNGSISAEEAKLWLQRLEWEGHEALFGTLTMYVCVGRKAPIAEAGATFPATSNKTGCHPNGANAGAGVIRTRRLDAASKADASLAEELTRLINDVYGISDTGVTLGSPRLALADVKGMLARGELIVAEQELRGADGPDTMSTPLRLLLGVVQVEVKGEGVNAGLPATDAGARLAEFSCLAVRAFDGTDGPPTPRGVGAALVRAAEAYGRSRGCSVMQMGILCPAAEEPPYKQWLQRWYLRLGYEHRETLPLRFEPDEVHEMYACLRQKVPCK